MRTFTLSMPEGDNLLSIYEDPNCSGQNRFSSPREAVSALPARPRAVRPLTEARRESATEHLSLLRARLNTFLKADGAMRISQIYPLQQAVQEFARRVEFPGAFPLARVVTAIESLIEKMGKATGKTGDSAARTLAHSFDFLASLVTHARTLDWNVAGNLNVMVVDDEEISRRAIAHALTGADLGCVSLDDPARALKVLAENQFDLAVVDIDMPGIDGYELCRRLRLIPGYAQVPVFFVTGSTDFQSRVQSLCSGGNDFISKPFLSDELAVKAMVSIFEQRLGLASKAHSRRAEVASGILPSRI